jgi:uncharacterized protein YhhL (DUF1145 family)
MAQKNQRSSQPPFPRSRGSAFTIPFWGVLILTLVAYFLRGIGILSFISGGILLILIGLTLVLALFYGIDKTRRF